MIQKTNIFLCTLLLVMVFSTLAVSGKDRPVPQAALLAEATFYVH